MLPIIARVALIARTPGVVSTLVKYGVKVPKFFLSGPGAYALLGWSANDALDFFQERKNNGGQFDPTEVSEQLEKGCQDIPPYVIFAIDVFARCGIRGEDLINFIKGYEVLERNTALIATVAARRRLYG